MRAQLYSSYRWWIGAWSVPVLISLALYARTLAGADGGEPQVVFQPAASAAAESLIQVSGFDVSFQEAAVNGFEITVRVSVSGRPETGDELQFVPGPTLVWPDGSESKVRSGYSQGREHYLTFERPSPTSMSAINLKMRVVSITSQSAEARASAAPPAYLLIQMPDLPSVAVATLETTSDFGQGAVVLQDKWQAPGVVRLSGRFVGFTSEALQNLTIRNAEVVTADGARAPISAWRSGTGEDGTGFSLTFMIPDSEVDYAQFEITARPTPGGHLSPEVASLVDSPALLTFELWN